MDRPTCETCPFFRRLHCDEDQGVDGSCHRYPPKAFGRIVFEEGEYELAGYQPYVSDRDWCGEHPDFPAYIASLRAAANA